MAESGPAVWSPGCSSTVLETERLRLRWVTLDDAGFYVEMLNDPGFLEQIGDRGVRTLDEARRYLMEGTLRSYAEHGYAMWMIECRRDGKRLGNAGLVRRPFLEHTDLGYALMPFARGRGVATEAARGVLTYARDQLGMDRLLAITAMGNLASGRVLAKLGFVAAEVTRLPDGEEVRLFEWRRG